MSTVLIKEPSIPTIQMGMEVQIVFLNTITMKMEGKYFIHTIQMQMEIPIKLLKLLLMEMEMF